MKVATTGIIEKNGKILIAKRTKKDKLWEFPGGKVDPGETPQECVIREIKEELEIDTEVTNAMGIIMGDFRDKQMEMYGFVLTHKGGKIKKNVHTKVKWINSNDLEKYDFIEEDIPVWRRYQEIKEYKEAYHSPKAFRPILKFKTT